jgi:hypothetical protein
MRGEIGNKLPAKYANIYIDQLHHVGLGKVGREEENT